DDSQHVGTPEVTPLWPETHTPHQHQGCNQHRNMQHPIQEETNRRRHQHARMRRHNRLYIEGPPPVIRNRHSPAGLADQGDSRHESQDVRIMQRQRAADIPVDWKHRPDRLKQRYPKRTQPAACKILVRVCVRSMRRMPQTASTLVSAVTPNNIICTTPKTCGNWSVASSAVTVLSLLHPEAAVARLTLLRCSSINTQRTVTWNASADSSIASVMIDFLRRCDM